MATSHITYHCLLFSTVVTVAFKALPVYDHHQASYGVHTAAQLSGLLVLRNGTFVCAQLPDGFNATATHELRAVMFLIDPHKQHYAQLVITPNHTQKHNHLMAPEWQQELAEMPKMQLQPLKYHNRVEQGNITIPRVEPAVASDMMKVLDARSQRYKYLKGMLTAQGPLHYRGPLDAGALHTHYGAEWALCVDGWWGCARVPASTLTRHHPMMAECGTRVGPQYWLLFKTFYAASHEAEARRLYAALAYHKRLGFHGAILYENGGYIDALSQHPLLAESLADGSLQLMHWGTTGGTVVSADNTQANTWPEFGVFDQEMQYTHAAMAMWGLNAYLLYTDVDEFLVVNPVTQQPPNTKPQQDCFRGLLYMQLNRINYVCDSALGDPRLHKRALMEGGPHKRALMEGAPHPRALLAYQLSDVGLEHTAAVESIAEANRGLAEQMHAFVIKAKTAKQGASYASQQKADALRAYLGCTLTAKDAWNDWPKVFAYADAISSMVVHEGLVWPQYANATKSPVPSSCAQLVHIHNLAFDREKPEDRQMDKYMRDDSWLLPFKEVLRGLGVRNGRK